MAEPGNTSWCPWFWRRLTEDYGTEVECCGWAQGRRLRGGDRVPEVVRVGGGMKGWKRTAVLHFIGEGGEWSDAGANTIDGGDFGINGDDGNDNA